MDFLDKIREFRLDVIENGKVNYFKLASLTKSNDKSAAEKASQLLKEFFSGEENYVNDMLGDSVQFSRYSVFGKNNVSITEKDENGRQREIAMEDKDGDNLPDNVYQYEKNEKGNTTKKIEDWNADSNPEIINEVEYYEDGSTKHIERDYHDLNSNGIVGHEQWVEYDIMGNIINSGGKDPEDEFKH